MTRGAGRGAVHTKVPAVLAGCSGDQEVRRAGGWHRCRVLHFIFVVVLPRQCAQVRVAIKAECFDFGYLEVGNNIFFRGDCKWHFVKVYCEE